MRIERCVCTNQCFADVLETAACESLTTLDQIAAATGAGGQCGRCRPYLAVGLQTGQTVFHDLLPSLEKEEAAKPLAQTARV